jgi:hypothetical protein
MNLKSIVIATTLLTGSAIALTSPAFATTFSGGGYTVEVDYPEGADPTYYGCNPKGQCVSIEEITSYRNSPERYVWKNAGYSYILTQTSRPERYRLRVLNPYGQTILNRLLTNLDYTGGH